MKPSLIVEYPQAVNVRRGAEFETLDNSDSALSPRGYVGSEATIENIHERASAVTATLKSILQRPRVKPCKVTRS